MDSTTLLVKQLMHHLQENSSVSYQKNVEKLGIPQMEAFGVPTSLVRKITRTVPKNQQTKELIMQLWETNYHEAKIIGTLLIQPEMFSSTELDYFLIKIKSWDLCDLFSKTVLSKRKDSPNLIKKLLLSKHLYYKRAAFSSIAGVSTHQSLDAEEIQTYLTLISTYSDDDRLLIKKAASWALRDLGKINEQAQGYSIATAQKLLKMGTSAQQWIAKNALKELTTLVRVSGRTRLLPASAKMAQRAPENG